MLQRHAKELTEEEFGAYQTTFVANDGCVKRAPVCSDRADSRNAASCPTVVQASSRSHQL